VAGRLQGAVRESDLVARHGGDEFLVLLDELPGPADADPRRAADISRMVAERVREALDGPVRFAGSDLHVTGSIGIALSRGSREDEAWLVRRADAAMYRTKREAPGGIALASEQDEPVQGELLAARLRRAIDGEGLVVHYLPVVDLSTRHVVGVEALVRWRDESGRLIPPSEFLTLAEDLGLIGAIDERVMADAFARCRSWDAQGLNLAQVSVNLSALEVAGADLQGDMMRRIEASGVDPARVMLEVPESSALTEGRARQALVALRGAGVRLAVDDFGTGVSSLAGLRDLPIDVIKLDRPLLRGVPDDPGALRLLEAVVGLIRSLGAEPMAEGVETEGQRTALLGMGCSLGQGFRFSPAIPAEEVEQLVRSGSIGG
jgi:predicted signal transduction protein with EAL and GGDEF domain